MKKKILVIFGTRPELLKLFDIIKLLDNDKDIDLKVLNTSQHSDLLKTHLNAMPLKIDYFNKIKNFKDISASSIYISRYLDKIIKSFKPHLVIYQGDTLSAFLASFYANLNLIKTMHIEAGLRTFDRKNPWPEESFRNAIKEFTNYHCAPTKIAKKNLINENVKFKNIKLTGNTIVDILKDTIKKNDLKNNIYNLKKPFIYITIHRRENIGKRLHIFCDKLKLLSYKYKNFNFYIPVHSNPNISKDIFFKLSNIDNIKLIKPLNYISNLCYIANSHFVISDSGGIQEEVASLKKKILIYRKLTERPEILKHHGILIDENNFVKEFKKLVKNPYPKNNKNPFGDGNASTRVHKFIKNVI